MQIGENSRGDNSAFWVFCWRENFYCPIFWQYQTVTNLFATEKKL
jgi:hypothetical protein